MIVKNRFLMSTSIWTLEPWNEFEVAWQFPSKLIIAVFWRQYELGMQDLASLESRYFRKGAFFISKETENHKFFIKLPELYLVKY